MIVKIEDFVNGGYGLTFINGKAVFIEYVLPGETVEIEITKEKKSYAKARLVKILDSSDHRVEPLCKHYTICGGCNLQHANYQYQLLLKRNIFVNTLKRVGKVELSITPQIVSSPKQFNYRSRVDFKCRNGYWGFYKKSTNQFVKIDNCPIADDSINEYIKKYRCVGLERIEVDDFGNINADEMLLDIGLHHLLFYKKGAFSQVNREVNLKIIQTVLSLVKTLDVSNIVEFFSGIGNFTIPLAKEGYNIIAVELNTKAVSSLKRNINTFGLTNIKYRKIDLSMPFRLKTEKRCELALLDPPRDGAKQVVSWILEKEPKYVIYISCDPATLSRDISRLIKKYSIKHLVLFDMFPQTHHIESLTLLEFNKNSSPA